MTPSRDKPARDLLDFYLEAGVDAALGEQPVDVASAAYLVQGVPVVVDSSSGLASTVFRDAPSPEWFDGDADQRAEPEVVDRGQ